jgi:hypothetical protein
MRLGEARKILGDVLIEGNKLNLQNEPKYNGQAFLVKNFLSLSIAIKYLDTLSWNDAVDPRVTKTIAENEFDEVVLPLDSFNTLKKYIDKVNNKLPLFIAVLDTVVEKQDEKTINVKLNIDGEFSFKGFDKGSDWYVFATVGILTYQYFLGCLDILKKYFEFREAYYDSQKAVFKAKQAEVEYKAALKAIGKDKDYSEDGVKKYIDNVMDSFLEKEATRIIEQLKDLNGKTKQELETQIVMATKELVKACENGTEFHISLNPPEYAREKGGLLTIDYKKINSLNTATIVSELKSGESVKVENSDKVL